MNVALRLSLVVNVVICSLGIIRVCLVHLSAADADSDRDLIVDVSTHLRAHVSSNDSSQYLVPNIVHYIWSAHSLLLPVKT